MGKEGEEMSVTGESSLLLSSYRQREVAAADLVKREAQHARPELGQSGFQVGRHFRRLAVLLRPGVVYTSIGFEVEPINADAKNRRKKYAHQ